MISIVESKFIKSAVKPVDYHPTPYIEIAVVGKSNVGKSSLINVLLNRKSLAKVSSTPGKTRLINFFEVRIKMIGEDTETGPAEGFFSLADLPGYGFAKVSSNEREKWRRMVSDYFRERVPLRAVLVLVDIRHKADPKDIAMFNMLEQHEKPYLVVATKSDKIPKNKIKPTITSLARDFTVDNSNIIPFSSLKKKGLPELLSVIEQIVLGQVATGDTETT